MADKDRYSFGQPPPEVVAAAAQQLGIPPGDQAPNQPYAAPKVPRPSPFPNVSAPLSLPPLPHPALVDQQTTRNADIVASRVVPQPQQQPGLQGDLAQASAQMAQNPPPVPLRFPNPQPVPTPFDASTMYGQLTQPSPGQGVYPDTLMSRLSGLGGVQRLGNVFGAPPVNVEGLQLEAAVPGTGTPSKIAKGVIQGGEEAATGLISPKNIALMAGTFGLGGIPALNALVSGGFALDSIWGAAKQYPQLRDQISKGDVQGAARTLASMGIQATMGAAAGLHGVKSGKAAVGEFRQRRAAGRGAAPEAPQYTTTGQPVGGEPPAAPAAPAPAAQPTRSALRVKTARPPARPPGALSDEALQHLLAVERGPKRKAYVALARERGIPVEEDERGPGPEIQKLSLYHDLFDQASRRMEKLGRTTAPRAAVPSEGPSEHVQRVVQARNDLAQQFFKKPWSEIGAGDRIEIDDLIVKHDLGFTAPAAQESYTIKEPPAEVKAAAEKQTGKETEEHGQPKEIRADAAGERKPAPGKRGKPDEQPQLGGERAPAVNVAGPGPAAPAAAESADAASVRVTTPTAVAEADEGEAPEAPKAEEPEEGVVRVDPKRLESGKYVGNKRTSGGDIVGSYSGDKIGEKGSVIRKPFTHDGKLWVAVAGTHRPGETSYEAYRLVPLSEFEGKPTTYDKKTGSVGGAEAARADPNGFYHGVTVKSGGKEYVMVGPEVRFTAGEEAPAAKPAAAPTPKTPEITRPDSPQFSAAKFNATRIKNQRGIIDALEKAAKRPDVRSSYVEPIEKRIAQAKAELAALEAGTAPPLGEPERAEAPAAAPQTADEVLQKLQDGRARIADLSGEEFTALLELGRETAKASKAKVRDKLLDETMRLNAAYGKQHPEQSQNKKPYVPAENPKLALATRIGELRDEGMSLQAAMKQAEKEGHEIPGRKPAAKAAPTAPEIANGTRVTFLLGKKPLTGVLTRIDRKASPEPIAHIKLDRPEDYYGGLKTALVALSKVSVYEEPVPKNQTPKALVAKRIRQLRRQGMEYDEAYAQAMGEHNRGELAAATAKPAEPAPAKVTKKAAPPKAAEPDQDAEVTRLRIISFVRHNRATLKALGKTFPNDAEQIRWLADRGMISRHDQEGEVYYAVPAHGRDYEADTRIDKGPKWWTAKRAKENAYEPEPAQPAAAPDLKNGVAMSLYEPASKRPTIPKPPANTQYGPTGMWNLVEGEVWHTDGHGAWRGEYPTNWGVRRPNLADKNPDIARAVGKEKGRDVTPIGFSEGDSGGTSPKPVTRVWFSDGSSVDRKYFDYTNRIAPGATWSREAPSAGRTPGNDSHPYQAWDKDGKRAAVLAPFQSDVIPENLKGAVEGVKPVSAKKKKLLERLDEAGRESDEWLRKNGPTLSGFAGSVDPKFAGHMARSIAGMVARGILDFKTYSKNMLDVYGPAIRPYLKPAWDQAVRLGKGRAWRPGMPLEKVPGIVVPKAKAKVELPDVLRYLETQTRHFMGAIPADASPAVKKRRLWTLGRREMADQMTKPYTGETWYTDDTRLFDSRASKAFPELEHRDLNVLNKIISAVTSGDQTPAAEAYYGAKIWEIFRKTGKIPLRQPGRDDVHWPGQGSTVQLEKIQRMLDHFGGVVMKDGIVSGDSPGIRDLVRFVMEDHTVTEMKVHRPSAPGKMHDVVPGATVFGPKFGRYLFGLLGVEGKGTAVDKWDVRGQYRRLGRPLIHNDDPVEVPSPESERDLFMGLHAALGKRWNMMASSAQSVVWHYEQALYRALGYEAPSLARSEGIARYLREAGIPYEVDDPGRANEPPDPVRGPQGGTGQGEGDVRPAGEAGGSAAEGKDGRRRSREAGAIDPELLNALTLGLGKFLAEDVVPKVKDVALGIAETATDIRRILFPTLMDRPSKRASFSLRANIAEMQRRYDRARYAMNGAFRYFERQKSDDNLAFMHRMETGQPQPTPELQAIADALRALLDGRRLDVQALGTGKLQHFYTDYFPHIWENVRKARNVMAEFFGRRPLEGSKAFLKKRTLPTIQDGIARGLKPVSDNPVTLALLKVREMDRYIMAHTTRKEWARTGLARYYDARKGKPPKSWRKLPESIGTVYGPSVQAIAEYPNEGLWKGLEAVARALGISHTRGFHIGLPPGALGASYTGKAHVKTAHGTAEGTLAHEIGHQIDELAGSGRQFVLEYPDPATVARIKAARQTLKDPNAAPAQRTAARQELKSLRKAIADRVEFAQQLRNLADLRTGGSQAYRRSREEKMAQLAQMWVEGRDLFEKTAPLVFRRWKKFLRDNPKLHALRDIEASANKTEIAQPYDVGGLVVRGHWYAPAGAARIMDNYLSPGLREYAAYRGIMGANNLLNQYQLGLSAFHLGFTAADATVSKNALAWQSLLRGHPIRAAKYAAQTPFASFTYFLEGNKMLKEWYKPGSQGAAIGRLVDGLVIAGGRARMDAIWRTHMHENMMAAYRKGNILGAALRAAPSAAEAFSNLIMDQVVPRMKLGAFADMFRAHLEQLGPNADFNDVRRVAIEDWNSVENRLGEMTYDNLFWNRYLKDLSMLTVRSVGWNLGTLREIGGGIGDIVAQPVRKLRGEPVNLNRLSYIMGLVSVNAAMSMIYQYLHTGKPPDQLEDYFFPKTGQLDERGRPQRVSWPTYVKDVYHYGTRPVKTIANKIAPIWSAIYEMAKNKDFYGNQIRNADDPLVQQLSDLAKHAAKQAIPLTARNIQRERTLGASPEMQAEQFVGITPAPSDLDQTPAERLASDLMGERTGGEPGRPADAAERRDLRQSLARALRQGKALPPEVLGAMRAGKLSSRDLKDAYRTAHEAPLQNQFLHLSMPDALKVYKAATAQERAKLKVLLARKAKAALRSEPPAQRLETLKGLREAFALQ